MNICEKMASMATSSGFQVGRPCAAIELSLSKAVPGGVKVFGAQKRSIWLRKRAV